MLPAESAVFVRSGCKIARAEMERVGELAAIVIVKMGVIEDIEKVPDAGDAEVVSHSEYRCVR